MNACCVTCKRVQPVSLRANSVGLGVILMRCQSCGHWIKCPKCMAIRSTTHQCAGERDVSIPG